MSDLAQTDRAEVASQAKVHWRSLVKQSEFRQVYGKGVKIVGRLVVVYLMAPAGGSPRETPAGRPDLARAVVASRKVGNAVARNRAKRLLREAHRLGLLGQPGQADRIRTRFLREPDGIPDHAPGAAGSVETPGAAAVDAPDAKNFAGLWVVLVARRRILGASSREVREELDALLEGTAAGSAPESRPAAPRT